MLYSMTRTLALVQVFGENAAALNPFIHFWSMLVHSELALVYIFFALLFFLQMTANVTELEG